MTNETVESALAAKVTSNDPEFKFRCHRDAEALISDLREVAGAANSTMSQLITFELRLRSLVTKLEFAPPRPQTTQSESYDPRPLLTNREFRELLTQKEAARAVGVCVNTLRKMSNEGRFPKPFQRSARRLAFRRNDVEMWINGGAVSD